MGLEKFHTHTQTSRTRIGDRCHQHHQKPIQSNPAWRMACGANAAPELPKTRKPNHCPCNSARTKNHQKTDHSGLTNLTHRDLSMHAYAPHRDLNILSCKSVHKKIFPSISYILPITSFIIQNTDDLGNPEPSNMNSNIPNRCLGWIKAQVKQGIPDLDHRFFLSWTNSTASPQPGFDRFPEHIVLRTPSSSDQVSLSWARWRSCTFMSFTWTVVCNKQVNSKYQFQHNWTYVFLIVFVAIAPELTKKNQDAG